MQSKSPTETSVCKELTNSKNTPKLNPPTKQSGNKFYPVIQLPFCPSRNLRCQGPTGPKGETGATGPTGPTGPKGNRGFQGIQGCQGPKGDQGPRGDIGPQGDPGCQGERGPKGNPGCQGPRGPQGPVGPKGDIGPRGCCGPRGEQGRTGDTGRDGPAGIMGPQGEIGPTGPMGLRGEKGCQGIEGPQGERGYQGVTGPTGPTGATPILTGAEYSLEFPQELTQRILHSGSTLKFNNIITDGDSAISYDLVDGTFIISKIARYLITLKICVSQSPESFYSILNYSLNGVSSIKNEIFLDNSRPIFYTFTDILNVESEFSEFKIINSGDSFMLNDKISNVATLTFWGITKV